MQWWTVVKARETSWIWPARIMKILSEMLGSVCLVTCFARFRICCKAVYPMRKMCCGNGLFLLGVISLDSMVIEFFQTVLTVSLKCSGVSRSWGSWERGDGWHGWRFLMAAYCNRSACSLTLLQVSTLGERVVLYVLNRVIYRKQEMERHEIPFLCHSSTDYAKILWKKGEAVGFYSVKPTGEFSTFLKLCYRNLHFDPRLCQCLNPQSTNCDAGTWDLLEGSRFHCP